MTTETIPCISLWQPWAWLLVHGHEHPDGKRVENRTWPLPAAMIGRWCLIHAAKAIKPNERLAAGRVAATLTGWAPRVALARLTSDTEEFPLGGIVGAVKWETCCEVEALFEDDGLGAPPPSIRAWAVGPHCWITSAAKPLPFVSLCGRQGFWNVPLSSLPDEYQWLKTGGTD